MHPMQNRVSPSQRPVLLATLLLVGLVGCSGFAGCGSSQHEPAHPPAALPPLSDDGLPSPTLRLAIITDLKGYLEPCGCTSRPLGGIDHLASEVAKVRALGPTLFLASGNSLYDGLDHHVAGSNEGETQERWKAESVVQILDRLGTAAAGVGKLDLSLGLINFSEVANAQNSGRFPFLLDNYETLLGTQAGRIFEVANLKIGVVSVADLSNPDGSDPPGLIKKGSLADVARATATSLRDRGAQLVVALVSGTRRDARQVAALDGIDFVVEGGVDEQQASPPAVVGPGVVVHASRQGQGLLVIDVFRTGAGTWTDVGAWSRQVERTRIEQSISVLEARLAEWNRDPNANRAEVDQQKAHLAELRSDDAALSNRPQTEGNFFAARFVELTQDHASDASVKEAMKAYSHRVNEHNREAFANLLPKPAAEGQPHYVGVGACESCHSGAVRWWRTTPHGHAYMTLSDREKQYNLSCVGCHVTGYNQPGGSTVTHNEGLVDVQCEQCHGPGSAHVANPSQVAMLRTDDVPESVCLQCHTTEHSDLFNYTTYKRLLKAPGHGEPLALRETPEHARTRLASVWLAH